MTKQNLQDQLTWLRKNSTIFCPPSHAYAAVPFVPEPSNQPLPSTFPHPSTAPIVPSIAGSSLADVPPSKPSIVYKQPAPVTSTLAPASSTNLFHTLPDRSSSSQSPSKSQSKPVEVFPPALPQSHLENSIDLPEEQQQHEDALAMAPFPARQNGVAFSANNPPQPTPTRRGRFEQAYAKLVPSASQEASSSSSITAGSVPVLSDKDLELMDWSDDDLVSLVSSSRKSKSIPTVNTLRQQTTLNLLGAASQKDSSLSSQASQSLPPTLTPSKRSPTLNRGKKRRSNSSESIVAFLNCDEDDDGDDDEFPSVQAILSSSVKPKPSPFTPSKKNIIPLAQDPVTDIGSPRIEKQPQLQPPTLSTKNSQAPVHISPLRSKKRLRPSVDDGLLLSPKPATPTVKTTSPTLRNPAVPALSPRSTNIKTAFSSSSPQKSQTPQIVMEIDDSEDEGLPTSSIPRSPERPSSQTSHALPNTLNQNDKVSSTSPTKTPKPSASPLHDHSAVVCPETPNPQAAHDGLPDMVLNTPSLHADVVLDTSVDMIQPSTQDTISENVRRALQNPNILAAQREQILEALQLNRKKFERSLRESWPRTKREEIKQAKDDLMQRSAVLQGVLDLVSKYHELAEQKEALLLQISNAYDQGLSTDEDEAKLDTIHDQIRETETIFSAQVLEAGFDLSVPENQPPLSYSQSTSSQSSSIVQLPPDHHQAQKNVPSSYNPVIVPQSSLPPPFAPPQAQTPWSPSRPTSQYPHHSIAESPPRGGSHSQYESRQQSVFTDDFVEIDDDDDMLALAESFEQSRSSRPLAPPPQPTTHSSSMSSSKANPTRKGETTSSNKPEKYVFPPEQMRYPWSPDVKQMLKDRFRMKSFRHNQLEAINATLSGKDAFILMPTGGGKSLCYQLPAVVKSGTTSGITIVVSPLISLMHDQVHHLKELGIHAITYNGEASAAYKDMVMNMFRERNPENFIELLYITPEMINKNQRFLNSLKMLHAKNKLARIVIDEAHCVSQWGHDFRPDYKALGEIRQHFLGVPLMALTATATRAVITDIKHNLGMRDAESFSQSFNRPNLYYEVRKKTPRSIVEDIAALINGKFSKKCGIVYTLSRKQSELVAEKLRGHGIKAHHYHALLGADEKVSIQQQWQQNKIHVVVATIAFGMGIDKPDVRFVIHHCLPKSLEGYYQETGRAGRDGKPSECYLYFSLADATILRKMINDGEGNYEQKNRLRTMLNRVILFCDSPNDCRRVDVLRYFGESFTKEECHKTCDNCLNETPCEMRDVSDIAVAALEVVASSERLTLIQCVEVLMGKRQLTPRSNVTAESMALLERYRGVASSMKKHLVERIVDRLLVENGLAEGEVLNRRIGFSIQYLGLGPESSNFRRGKKRLTLMVPLDDAKPKTSSKAKKKSAAPAMPELDEYEEGFGDAADSPYHVPSTNVSSPVRSTRKKKPATTSASTSSGNRPASNRQSVISIEDVDDEYDAQDGFEPLRTASTTARSFTGNTPSTRNGSKSIRAMYDSAANNSHTANVRSTASTNAQTSSPKDPIHADVVETFVREAKDLDERIRNDLGLRKPLFTEMELRHMAIRWTTTMEAMRQVGVIDAHRVAAHGAKFLPLIRSFHQQYLMMMGGGPTLNSSNSNSHQVIPASSTPAYVISDNDDMEDMEMLLGDDPVIANSQPPTNPRGPNHPTSTRSMYFQSFAFNGNQPPREEEGYDDDDDDAMMEQAPSASSGVLQWHEQLEHANKGKPKGDASSNSRSSGSSGGSFRRASGSGSNVGGGGRGGRRRSWTKRAGGHGSARTTTSSATGSGRGRGGRSSRGSGSGGGGGGTGGGSIGLMPI